MPYPANYLSFQGENARSTPVKKDVGASSVRSKVLSWQQQTGTAAPPDLQRGDKASHRGFMEEDSDEAPFKSDHAEERVGKKYAPTAKRHSKSAPRKRVISDEHWKLNRNSAPSTPSTAKRQPGPNKISSYTSNDELLSAQKGARGGRRDVLKDDHPPSYFASQSTDRVHAIGRDRKMGRSPRAVQSVIDEEESWDSPSDGNEDAGYLHDENSGSSPPPDALQWGNSEANFTELSRRRARGTGKQHPGDQRRNSRGGIFSQMLDESKKIFADPQPPKPQSGAKIEAWLSDTPDSFPQEPLTGARSNAPLATPPRTPPHRQQYSPRQMSPRREAELDSAANGDASSESDSRKKLNRMPNKAASPVTKREGPFMHERKSPGGSRDVSPDKEKNASTFMKDRLSPSHRLSDEADSGDDTAVPPELHRKPLSSSAAHLPLSTIDSNDTLRTSFNNQAPPPPPHRDPVDIGNLSDSSSNLKRRLTTHEDLMSVLSVSKTGSRGIRSAVRDDQCRLDATTIDELLEELAEDEATYMRELKTLVEGVIPVLLSSVLSKSDSALAAGLFQPSADPKDNGHFTKPIVDMGVTLERLKTLHKRIPQGSADSLIQWGQGAQRVYRDYVKAWTLGFKDVIVNLAPQERGKGSSDTDSGSSDEGMARDENGDVIGSDGEKVDVAYLLKRPLVRLKYLAKTFKGVNTLQPSSKAEAVADGFQNLVVDARKRVAAERARLEDESAANIDSTRACDPRTMAPMTEVNVNKTRRVRARDFFELSLDHSNGQVIDCRAELLLRDNLLRDGPGGDLLICEIDQSDRWLLFPPIELDCVSARRGDVPGELVVILRSAPGQSVYWQESLYLEVDDESISSDWVHMLGPKRVGQSSSSVNVPAGGGQRMSVAGDGGMSTSEKRVGFAPDVKPPQHLPPSAPAGELSSSTSTGGKISSFLKRGKAMGASWLQEAGPSSSSSSAASANRTYQPAKDKYKAAERVSSVPSMEPPSVPKLRSGDSASNSSETEGDDALDSDDDEPPPAPPLHRSTGRSPGVGTGTKGKRHGSSPLKHEYQPSTASDSYCSDTSTVRCYGLDDSTSLSSSSDSDSDDEAEGKLPFRRGPADSALPSKSASSSPHRAVPPQPTKVSKAIASVLAWSDRGSWTNLAQGECSIHVTPGLIEVYSMKATEPGDESSRKIRSTRPLVGLELTPLVPIRRGTAIDISVRSPPTKRSKVTTSNNIMFRSRNAEDCDALYRLINQARTNNPTYIALQNARGGNGGGSATGAGRDGSAGGSSATGWFGWPRRKKSYRASPAATRSSADASESSVGSMSSAFSALRRLGAGSKMFSVAQSTVLSKSGNNSRADNSMFSRVSATATKPRSTSGGIGRIAAAIRGADGIGLSNAKIRLYVRENASKWRDMGAARLTIMPAPSASLTSPASANAHKRQQEPGGDDVRRATEPTRRILVNGKTRGEVLLDVCLGESSFERVARTGIAVSVWEANKGGAVAKSQGGVTVGAYKVYMIQMKSEAEAAYTFGLVGKLRY